MSDEADYAAQSEELDREAARLMRHKAGPKASGWCLNCGEVIAHPLRWCDRDCREDWVKREDQ